MSDVSVVIPAYNAARYVEEAIVSVVEQTEPPAEVVVVDDGSTDATADVASRFGAPVRCVRRPRGGTAVALNTGLEHTSGALLAFLDADDTWLQDKLALQTEALRADPRLDFVLGEVEEFRSAELAPADAARLALRSGVSRGVSKGTMLIRRQSFMRVGAFATDWRAGEFIDWYARAIDLGLNGAMVPRVVMRRRLHLANSGTATDARADYPRVLKAVIDRRRAAGA